MSDVSEKMRKLEKDVTELRLQYTLKNKEDAWNGSWVKIALTISTVYVAAVALLVSLQFADAFVQALIPTLVVVVAMPIRVYLKKWYTRNS